jgi:hypothetical protein
MRSLAVHQPLLLVACCALAGCGVNVITGPAKHETRVVELNPPGSDKSEMARIDIRMAAGELELTGGAPELADCDFTYNVPSWKPMLIDDSTGVRREIRIEQPGNVRGGSNTIYKWNLSVNNDIPLDVVAHLGAGTARVTLGTVNLRSLDIEMGVGELHLDLTGTPRRDYNVNLEGGVGQATVLLPASAGIIANAEGGIGSISVKGLEQRDGSWINPVHQHAPATIRLKVEGGVGQINIVAQ